MIDLRSDVVSRVPDKMRQVMYEAEVGDDVFDDDPTARRLETTIAEMFGVGDALITPSTTMGNLIATKVWTNPGDEVIIWGHSHAV